jgi:hypothetical protein
MLIVLLPRRTRRSPRVWHLFVGCLGLALVLLPVQQVLAQDPPKNERKAAPKAEQDDGDQPKAKTPAGAADKKGDAAAAPDAAGDSEDAAKAQPYKIFRDPKAEKLLGVDGYPHLSSKAAPVTQGDLQALNGMAGADQIDISLVNRVVDAMVSKLTDHANIEALSELDSKLSPTAPANRAINEATNALLEPIFLARANKNTAFLSQYTRVLDAKITPLLKNHLIPRVQAMIILGQLGSGDLMKTYVAQIKEPNQTVWVKLWAFQGIVNAVEEGARIPGDTQVSTAKIIAEFLTNSDDVPYPVQLRALEALSALKQGCDTNRPERATMATAAMKFLADREAEFEVRSEAARALGLMAIPATVRKYNYPLVAHSIGALVADLGTQINALVPERTLRTAAGKAATAPDASKPSSKALGKPSGKASDKPSGKPSDKTPKGKALAASTSETAKAATPAQTNPLKAQYFTTLLIGPVYQAFEGVPGPRGETGGLVRSSSSEGAAYSQKVFDLIKPVAKGAVELMTSGSRQINDKKKALHDRVEALRDFLEKNAPSDRHLVQGGEDFPLAQALGK